MADSSVPITAGSGTNIDTVTQANGDHRQVTVVGDPVNTTTAKVQPWGAEVSVGLATLFYDTFVGPLDTTDKWTTSGTAPTFTAGALVMSATVSTYNTIRTKDTIRANAGFTVVRNGLTVEAATATGAGRFWGLGTVQGSPTATSLAADGIGFEIDQASGALLAVTYVSGVRTTVATLTRPTDGAIHAYETQFRVTAANWLIDGAIVASLAFPNVQVVELPALIVRQNAASFTGTPVLTNTAFLTATTDPQNKILADPIVGARQARVKPGSSVLAPGTDNALLVTQTSAQALTVGTGAAPGGSGSSFNARGVFTTTTSTQLVAAPAAGLSLYITDVTVSNSGATLSVVFLLPSAGTSVFDIAAAPAGGGGSMSFKTPLKITAATALFVTPSAASTSIYVTVTGYVAP